MTEALVKAGMGAPGKPNTLWDMVQGQEALRTGDWLVAWLYCYEELRQRGGALPPLDCGVDDPQLCVPPADRLRVCAQICVGQALALQRRVEGR